MTNTKWTIVVIGLVVAFSIILYFNNKILLNKLRLQQSNNEDGFIEHNKVEYDFSKSDDFTFDSLQPSKSNVSSKTDANLPQVKKSDDKNYFLEADKALLLTGEARLNALGRVSYGWSKKDPRAAAEWAMANLKDKELEFFLSRVAEAWASRNPDSATSWALTALPDGPLRDKVMSAILASWLAKEPATAAEWALKLENYNQRNLAVAYVAKEWALVDPYAAAEWVLNLPPGVKPNYAYYYLGDSWTFSSPEEAIEFANKLENTKMKYFAWAGLAAGWAKSNPEEAGKWVLELPLPTPGNARPIANFCKSWAMDYPYDAANWALNVSDPEKRKMAISGTAFGWTYNDPLPATQWAMNLASQGHPDADFAMESVMRGWAKRDYNAAIRWLKNSSLPEKQKELLLNMLKKN